MVDFPEDTGTGSVAVPHQSNEAARVGAGLREVRERLGWPISDIAGRIRIRPAFLDAIESGDLSSLPGSVYRTGFVRSYAQILGLDSDEIIQRFRRAGQIDEPKSNEIKPLAPLPDRGIPKGAIIFIALIIAIGGYGLWYHHSSETRKLAQNVIQMPAKLQPLSTPPKVVPVPAVATTQPTTQASVPSGVQSNAPAASAPAASSATAESTTTATTPPATTAASAATSSPSAPATATAPVQPSGSTSATTVETAAPASTSPTSASTSPASAQPGMVIEATQPSWVQVTSAGGTILFSKVLDAGQSWPVPQMPGLKMTTGNAGGTVIATNGKAGEPLGASGVVLRNYALTPPAPNDGTTPTANNSTNSSPDSVTNATSTTGAASAPTSADAP